MISPFKLIKQQQFLLFVLISSFYSLPPETATKPNKIQVEVKRVTEVELNVFVVENEYHLKFSEHQQILKTFLF